VAEEAHHPAVLVGWRDGLLLQTQRKGLPVRQERLLKGDSWLHHPNLNLSISDGRTWKNARRFTSNIILNDYVYLFLTHGQEPDEEHGCPCFYDVHVWSMFIPLLRRTSEIKL
jgi:hypothetical protein